jgi:hypothetical protein
MTKTSFAPNPAVGPEKTQAHGAPSGAVTEADSLKAAPPQPVHSPGPVHQAIRHGAALLMLLLLCALSALPATIALVLLSEGDWIGGYILVGLALTSLAILLSTINREPDGPLGRSALTVGARGQRRARVARASVAARSDAIRASMRAGRRQQHLHAQRRDRVAALREAILHGDRVRAAHLSREARALRDEALACDRQASAIRSLAEDRAAERVSAS